MADITVQVSSPSLTAYGNNSWGSLTYGGDNIDIISTGTIDAYNSTGWGRLTWNSLPWGQDFESATVAVTTPGTPTTYGYESWGEFNWGQITGLATDQGEEAIAIGADLTLSTNLINTTTGTVFAAANFLVVVSSNVLNITTNSVFAGENVIISITTPGSNTAWGYNTWGSGAWNQISGLLSQSGDETITGTGIVDLTGSELNTTTGTFTIIGDANLTLSTNLLNLTIANVTSVVDVSVQLTSPGNLPWGATDWNYGSWGNIGGMDVSQGGEEVVVPSVEVDVLGNQLNTTIGTFTVTANANLTLSTNLLTISLGDEEGLPNTQVTLSTNLLTLSQGFASGEVLSTISVVGVTVTSQVGRVFVSAWAVVDIGVTNNWSVVDIAA